MNTRPDSPTHEAMRQASTGRLNMDVHYASEKQTWETPQDFFDLMDSEFHFDVDVCAEDETAKCNVYYTVDDDGLSKEWDSICWMNPPYGREIGRWMKKAYESAEHSGATVVCLVPARTDTAWWHDYVMKAHEVRFIRGRLRFGNATASAPFPSAVVVFRPFSTPMGFEVKTQEKQFTLNKSTPTSENQKNEEGVQKELASF